MDFTAIISNPSHMTMPVLNEPSLGEGLYFLPAVDALGLESGAPRIRGVRAGVAG
jgi:hypothetical protein